MKPTIRRNLRNGLLFCLPWLVGFSVFIVYPVGASLYYSFTDFSVLSPPIYIGGENYRMLLSDPVFTKALTNTLFFAAFSIVVTLCFSLFLALMLAGDRRGTGLYRTAFYLPVLVPQVVVASNILWFFHNQFGFVNRLWRPAVEWLTLHAPTLADRLPAAPNWISQQWAMTTLVIASVWSVGNAMVIYIAGLRDVPVQLYEAADLDGASHWRKAVHISLPMISPMILFNLIMGIIASFNVFAVPYFMTSGNKAYELGHAITFYAPVMNQTALTDMRMGYACAMGWVLFLIVVTLTAIVMRLSVKRVIYTGGLT
jgi:multiple sugar transport system permease protein